MESSRFPMFDKIDLYYVTIHFLKTIEWNADCDNKVNYDFIFYDVQTSDFIQIIIIIF